MEQVPESVLILDISDNKLEELPKLSTNIKKLDACKNNIKEINVEDIPTNIMLLDLTENPLLDTSKILLLDIENLYLDEIDHISSDNNSSDIDIPTNIKHRFNIKNSTDSIDSIDSTDSSDDDINLDSFMKVKTNNFTDNSNDNIDKIFANLRKNIIIEDTNKFTTSTRVSMNWNIVL